MPVISNVFMDQGRIDFLNQRVKASKSRGLLPAWPREERELPVVEVEVSWVRFSTLNHRTKAEQLRKITHSGQADLFTADPLGPLAQQAQYEILSSQAGFPEIKADLAERGQQEHAVITAEGVLINGNRRAAALQSLLHDDNNMRARYIRCLVLPADATPTELILLETELQVAKDFKQDYSWVNQALLIEELYNQNDRSFERVAAIMHRPVKEVREDYEKIQQVNQLVDLAGGKWLHIDFEPNESAFDELAQYIRNKTDEEKESTRAVYFLGTLAGVNYRDLRHLRRPDCRDLVHSELIGDPLLSQVIQLADSLERGQSNADDDLLDDILGKGSSSNSVSSVLNLLACQDKDAPVALPDGTQAELVDVLAEIARAVKKAADEAAEQKKDQSAVSAPIMRLEQAIQNIERAQETIDHARALPGWEEAKFLALVQRAKDLLNEFERNAQ